MFINYNMPEIRRNKNKNFIKFVFIFNKMKKSKENLHICCFARICKLFIKLILKLWKISYLFHLLTLLT